MPDNNKTSFWNDETENYLLKRIEMYGGAVNRLVEEKEDEKENEEKRKLRAVHKEIGIKKFLDICKEKKIQISEDFEKELLSFSNRREFEVVPDVEALDALVISWNQIWSQYCTAMSRNAYIEAGIRDLFQVGATASFGSPALTAYIGRIEGVNIWRKPPRALATCLNRSGHLRKNGVAFPKMYQKDMK